MQSHGQSLETTLAQVAHEILGIDADKIKVVHGDTAMTPYSTGTWGSRCMVMAGGAVSVACKELASRAAKVGAQLLQTDAAHVTVRGGEVAGPRGSITLQRDRADLVSAAAKSAKRCRHGRHGSDRSVTGRTPIPGRSATPRMRRSSRSIRRSASVEILDYVVVEDGGKLVNPMVVDGQILGGLAQGIGTALYEEMPFDAAGQPLASTLADYLLPGSTEVPDRDDRPHGDALALHRVRRQRHRRGRRHRAAGGNRERRQRCAAAACAPSFSFRRSRRIG